MDALKLRAVLGLDSSEYEQGLNAAENTATKKGGGIANILGGAAKVGGAAIAAAAGAVATFGAASVKSGAQFDSSMSQVAATMGVTVDEIEDLRNFAQEMGSTTAFSASQAADALNYMALAGYDATTSMNMLPSVLNLAAAGGMELASASDMITDSQSALGLSLEETSELVDKMAKASSKSNTSVSQLGEAILTIGGTAKNLAGGTTELSTALGILADNGVKGAEGGTALRNIILSLSAPTDTAAQKIEELGLSVFDAEGNMRNMDDIFADLNKSLGSLSQEEKTQALNKIFNKVDLKSVNALLDTSTDRWDELSGAIDNATGAADQMAKTQLDNLNGDITLFKSALEGAQIAISDELTPGIREFVQFGSDGLSKLTEAFREGGLGGAMDVFGDILSDGLSMIIEKLPDVINAGMQLLGALGQGLLDNLPVIIDAAIQIIMSLANGLIQALPQLIKGAFQIITGLAEGIIQALPQLIPALIETVLTIVSYLTDPANLTMLIEAAIQIILALVDGLIQALPQLIKALPMIVENIVTALIDNLPLLIEATITIIGALAQAIIENLPLLIAAAVQIIFALTQGLIESLPYLITAFLGILSELTRTLIASLPEFINNGIELVKAIVEGIVKTIGSIIKAAIKVVDEFIKGMTKGWSKIIQAGKDVIDKVKDGISQKIEDAKNWGKDLIQNFIDGIMAKWNALKETVSNVAQTVKDFLGFSEPKYGPLSNFHTYAPDMMKLFAEGIKDNTYLITDQIAKSFDIGSMITPQYDIIGSGGNEEDTYSMLQQILALLPQLANQQIVLDSGVLVGQTAPQMDVALGQIYSNRQRSV